MDGRSTSFSGGPSGSFSDNLLLASSSRQTLMPRRSLYRAFTKVKEHSASNLCWTLGTLMLHANLSCSMSYSVSPNSQLVL